MALLLFTAGCGALKSEAGAPGEGDQPASIQGQFVPLKIAVSKITVLPLAADEWRRPLVGIPGTIEVPPGPQRLFANFCAASAAPLSCRDGRVIEFDAEAGHSYRVDGSLNEKMWVVDTDTGAIVARSDRAK